MRLFVLTGAGMSAESGLGTFRDKGGLWAGFDPMKLATPQAFAADPAAVHAFYNMRRRNLLEAEPNAAHLALGHLATTLQARGGGLYLCTQNIDDLHERAGSGQVHHMHGELLRMVCTRCGERAGCRHDLTEGTRCAACGQVGGPRPDVVWFGEMPHGLDEIEQALESSDLFVAFGTSGAVYPAAGLVEMARARDIRTCEINLEPSDNAAMFDTHHYGAASKTVPAFVAGLVAGRI